MVSQKLTDGWDRRLRQAMKFQKVSVPTLQKRVSDHYPDLRGTSYGGVRNYTSKNALERPRYPRLELLRAFAEVLDVSYEWLAFERGAKTAVEQEGIESAAKSVVPLRLGQGLEERIGKLQASVSEAVGEALGVVAPPSGAVTPTWLPGALVLWSHRRTMRRLQALLRDDDRPALPEDGEDRELARETGQAIAAPLLAFGIDPASLEDTDLSNYVLAVTAALAPIVQNYPQLSLPKED